MKHKELKQLITEMGLTDFQTETIVRNVINLLDLNDHTNNTYPEFTEMYMRAKANQAFYIVDKMLDIVNDAQPDKFGRVEKANLQIRTYQWIASKLKCKAFGDKPEVKDELPPDTLTDSEKLDKILSTVSAGLKRKNASNKK